MGNLLASIGGALGGGLLGLGIASATKSKGISYQPLDIAKVMTEARTAAADNLKNSISLEGQYRPGTAGLRTSVDTALNQLLSGSTPGFAARDSLLSSLIGSNGTNSLLEESTNRILDQLRLGAKLDPETQAQVSKAALEAGGAAGISGSGASRGLVARDLGLTGLQLQQTRQQNALTAGQILQQSQLNALGAAGNAAALDLSRTGSIAGLIDARALPESGLSPGAIANLYIADNNAKNQVNATNASIGAQNRNATLNAMLGFGALGASVLGGKG